MRTLFILLLLITNIVNAQNMSQKFDTKDHKKAKGVWATVRYPENWKAKEGERPNMIQLFSGNYNGSEMQLMLQIKQGPEGVNIESECKNYTPKEWNEIFTDVDSGMFATNAKKIKIEGKEGAIVDITSIVQRVEIKAAMKGKLMIVCHNDKLINLWCNSFSMNGNVEAAKIKLENAAPLCNQYFNSFVLMERY